MKKKLLFILSLLAMSLLAFADMAVYVYKKDGSKVRIFAAEVDSIGFVDFIGIADGHDWVDLGLPSGAKWATTNVGATTPEEYGDYFAWGETTTNSSNTSSNNNPTTLPQERDAAYVNWGSSWRMPTYEEIDELINTSYTTWTWTTEKGVKGYKVTSKINGKSIFLPAAGFRYDSGLSNAGSHGYYWSSSLNTDDTSNPYFLYFTADVAYRHNDYFSNGLYLSVRPVLSDVIKYKVIFNSNGGYGSMQPIIIESTEQLSLPSNTFIRDGYEFTGWNTKADGSGTSYGVGAEVTLTSDITLYAQWEGFADGHEWVDLGLPSGTKWATTNVGAITPEGYGDYFAWGETTTNSSNTSSNNNPTTLPQERDAAYVNWGSSWRMPTYEEIDELINTSYTTWIWTTKNGVKGYEVTSKTNGNSIFLPAAGFRYDSGLSNAGSHGYYWSSSLNTDDSSNPYFLYFTADVAYRHNDYFSNGLYLSVRPVLRE